MAEHLLIVENVSKSFGDRKVLEDINLYVDRGEIVSLLGPNGAGKTTLTKIILGIYRPSSGSVKICGRDPREPSARSIVSYCPQEPGLRRELTGWENIMFYARLYDIPEDVARERARELLEKTGLLEHANRVVDKYSGGMKRCLSIITSLLHDPELLILDEPTTGLDPNIRRVIWDILIDRKKRGKSILFATHYMEEADLLSDRVYIIDRGKIIAEGTPEELKKKYGPKSVVEVELFEVDEAIEKRLREGGWAYSLSDNVVRIHTIDPDEEIPKLVSAIYGVGGKIKSLRIVKPTLEDVFIRLTGRRLE